jgi:hypothetical protein
MTSSQPQIKQGLLYQAKALYVLDQHWVSKHAKAASHPKPKVDAKTQQPTTKSNGPLLVPRQGFCAASYIDNS